jgi:hypothetical protein
LQGQWRWETDLARDAGEDFVGRDGGFLFCGDAGQRVVEFGVAILLAGASGGQGLVGRGELGLQLGAVAAGFAPGEDYRGGEEQG